jgi:hypothetical protein
MIENLTLSNFRKHRALVISFEPGLNSITGPNSAGKTNVLRGILYCLFGPTATGCPKDRLWRRGREAGEPCFAKLALAGGIEIYRSDREAVVRQEGTPVATGHSNVTKWVEEAFGMGQADLLTLMYSAQGDAQQILAMGATGLQRQVERLSGIEAVDRVLGLIGPDLDRATGALTALGEPIDLGVLEAEAGAARLAKAGAGAAADAASTAAEGATAARKEAAQAWQRAVEEAAQYEALLGGEARAVTALDDAAAALAAAKADKGLAEPATGLSGLREQLAEARARLEDVEDRLRMKAEREKALAGAESWLGVYRPQLARQVRLEADLAVATEDMQKIGLAWEGALLVKNRLEAAYERAESVFRNAACPECGRAFEGFDPVAAEAAMAAARDGLGIYSIHCDELEIAMLDKQKSIDCSRACVNPGLAKAVAQREKDALDFADALANPKEGPWPAPGEADVVRGQIKDVLEPALEVAIRCEERHAAAVAQLGKADEAYVSALLAFGYAQEAVESAPVPLPVEDMLLKLSEAQAAEDAAKAAHFAALRARSEAHGAWLAAEDARRLALQAEEKRLAAKNAVNGLAGLQKYLRSSRSRLSAEIWGGLLDYASHLVGIATGGRMGRLGRSEKGEFTAGGVPVDDDGGAMKSLAGLALRVSLARTFYGAGLPLLLDEVTDSATDSTATSMVGMLLSLNQQVIAISHRADVNVGSIIVLGDSDA